MSLVLEPENERLCLPFRYPLLQLGLIRLIWRLIIVTELEVQR